MREIKFRAWDGIKIIYDGDIYWPEHFNIDLKRVTGKCTVTHEGIYFWVHETRLPDATEKHFDHCSIRLPEGMQIMQFTGLKDKNGKEIYEGDIGKQKMFRETNQNDPRFIIGEISISPTQGVLVRGLPIVQWEIEIIGNIYENPELNPIKLDK